MCAGDDGCLKKRESKKQDMPLEVPIVSESFRFANRRHFNRLKNREILYTYRTRNAGVTGQTVRHFFFSFLEIYTITYTKRAHPHNNKDNCRRRTKKIHTYMETLTRTRTAICRNKILGISNRERERKRKRKRKYRTRQVI